MRLRRVSPGVDLLKNKSKLAPLLVGKALKFLGRLRGGGSALPGLAIERLDPGFVQRALGSLSHGVVVISGTNGKTTTTKMVASMLEKQGLRVFTNPTGSNFSRGVAAALIGAVDLRGRLAADVAVLELDEAHAAEFVRRNPPQFSLLLNVMRDQLDRFGEIDTTARLLEIIATATTGTVVTNRDDPRLSRIGIAAREAGKVVRFFGYRDALQNLFPSDDELADQRHPKGSSSVGPVVGIAPSSQADLAADVTLTEVAGNSAGFLVGERPVETTLMVRGVYNYLNAAAALALVRAVLGEAVEHSVLVESLAEVTPAFGRGETFQIDGKPLELVLVKNPSGFRSALQSFSSDGWATMIAINDDYADGQDVSWLWDVDFDSLATAVSIQPAGSRAFDMALRLQYEDVPVGTVTPDLGEALKQLLTVHRDKPKRIFCTYTAMRAIRRKLGKVVAVEVIR